MDRSRRRAFLETMAEQAESDHVRLKALELLDRLDEREQAFPERPDFAQSLAEDAERLERVVSMGIDGGLFDLIPAYREQVERRALEIVDDRARGARAAFAVVETEEAADVPEEKPQAEEPPEPPEAASEPADAPQLHPVDERAMRLAAADDIPSGSLLAWRHRS